MPTTYPFRLPDNVIARVPAPAREGRRYIDVSIQSVWDGILVVNSDGDCIGKF